MKLIDFAFIVLTTLVLTVGLIVQTTRLANVRREAVELGYAEWYTEEAGGIPDQWRWKGAKAPGGAL